MKKQAQNGKGLGGFMTGLLLATAIIIGILFFLNKSAQNGFKELSQPQTQASEPEVLQPKGASQSELTESASDTVASEKEASAAAASDMAASETLSENPREPAAPVGEEANAEVVPGLPAPLQPPASTKAHEGHAAGREADKQAAGNKHPDELKKKAEPAKPAEPVKKPAPVSKPATPSEKHSAKQPEKHTPAKPVDKAKPAQPTPEQILNSGSIEKARKAANEQAKSATQAHHATSSAAKTETAKKVIVQMGSYGDRTAADAQRAKLAMMGVQSAVAETTVNGKKVYRVQSGILASDAAKKVQQTLQKNGVNSFTRSAE